jgi:hypothetical protein
MTQSSTMGRRRGAPTGKGEGSRGVEGAEGGGEVEESVGGAHIRGGSYSASVGQDVDGGVRSGDCRCNLERVWRRGERP